MAPAHPRQATFGWVGAYHVSASHLGPSLFILECDTAQGLTGNRFLPAFTLLPALQSR